LQVRQFCTRFGIADRQPRPIIPGDRRTLNRKIVEWLANEAYRLELDNAPAQQIWSARKAAWAVEDLEQDINLIYQQMAIKGLQSIPNIGPIMAEKIKALMDQFSSV